MAVRPDTYRRLSASRGPHLRRPTRSGRNQALQLLLAGDSLPPQKPRATRDEAVEYPPYERCVDLVAGSLANIDIRAGRDDPELNVWMRFKEQDQPRFLLAPDPESDAWQWRYSCVRDLVEYGNNIALLGDIDHRTGRAAWCLPLPPEHLGIVEYGDGAWDYVYGGMVLDRGSVLHIKRGGLSGELLGRGASDQFARSLRIALTAEEWAGRYLEGGGVPPAIIQTQANIGPAKAAAFKNDWRRMLDSGEALLLPANATVTPLVSDAQRQQLIEARQWNAHLACQMVGVPTYKLGLEGPSMTYQNVEQAGIDWRIDTLDRYGQPIANAINKYLMPNGTTCRWMWAQVERTDAQTQATVTGTLYSSGVIERDEARARIGYAPAAKTIEEGGTPQGVPEPGPQEV